MPLPVGSINPIVAFAAMAASTALPPRSRICTPARAASGWLAATIPNVVATMERPTTGTFGCAAVDGCSSCAPAPDATPSAIMSVIAARLRLCMRSSGARILTQIKKAQRAKHAGPEPRTERGTWNLKPEA